MAIENGSVVILKSGGPHMTVEEMGEHKDARCSWFSRDDIKREWFSLIALRLAPPNMPPKTRSGVGVATAVAAAKGEV